MSNTREGMRMSQLFGDTDASGGKPLYLELRDKLRRAILSGELPPGKLPSARDMARLEHVSRNTVDAAYAYLADEGLVYVRRGQGTFVSEGASVKCASVPSDMDWEARISRAARAFTHYREEEAPLIHGGRDVISFTSLAPDHNTFAVQAFRKIMNDVLAMDDGRLLNYGYTRGYEPLRQYLLADMRAKGINTDGDELIIVNGFRQAVDLVTRVLVDEGRRVLVEAPTYNGVIGVLKSRMARIGAVDIDDQGMNPDMLEREILKERPALVYCVPTYQNPTGLNMPLERRREVLRVCAKYRVPLLEDGFNEELRFRGESYPTLKAMDSSGVVIYAGSFSKVLFPGLRIGWVLAPKAVYRYLLNEKFNQDIHTSTVIQAALCEFLKRGCLQRHLKASRALYRERMTALLDALEDNFSDIADWPRTDGGFSVFMTLHGGADTRALLTKAHEAGVMYVPGDVFYPDGRGRNSLRLGFSRLTPEQIREGVRRLRTVFD